MRQRLLEFAKKHVVRNGQSLSSNSFTRKKMSKFAVGIHPAVISFTSFSLQILPLGIVCEVVFVTFITSRPSCSTYISCNRAFSIETASSNFPEDEDKAKLKPSPEFLSSLDSNSRQLIDKIMAEIEIMEWMMPHPPTLLRDKQWEKLMTIEKTEDRVSYLRAYAKHVFRDEMREAKRKAIVESRNALLDFQRAKFDAGAMGYGPTMYEMIISNMGRNARRIKHIEGAAMWRTLRLNEKPRIVLDCQFIAKKFDDFSSRLATQLEYIIQENFRRREPFDLSIVNYDEDNPNCQVVTKVLKTQYAHQTVLPLHTNGDVVDLYNKNDIIYIAKWSKQVIHTPLNDKVYVICLGRDNRLPLGAARKRGCRTARIPFNEHFKLYNFHFLPFTSVVRVLHEVYQTGGDWHAAILNGISRRYFIPQEDNISRTMSMQARLKNEELTNEISQMVIDALQTDDENK
uniref:SAM-dependent MTase TRM10-type domain-containing protein n=1 Tax=Elaeophora elaphi TaxID=1147741 RepID=A0A0R3RR73_9BILA